MTPDTDFCRSQHSSPPPRSCGAETLRGAPRLTKWQHRQGGSGDRPWRTPPGPGVAVDIRQGRLVRGHSESWLWPWPHLNPGLPPAGLPLFALYHADLEILSNTLMLCKDLTFAGPERDRGRAPHREWGHEDWRRARVTGGRRCKRSARRRAARSKPRGRQSAVPGGAGPGRRDRQSPQNFAAPGPRPYLQGGASRADADLAGLTLSARGGPARRRARTRARLSQRLGSGSARAPPPAPRLQPEWGRTARPRPPAPSGRGRC